MSWHQWHAIRGSPRKPLRRFLCVAGGFPAPWWSRPPARRPTGPDTPRPDARNVVLYAVQVQAEGSGFRFWDDLNADGRVQSSELGIVRSGTGADIDFAVDRDGAGDLFLTPVRLGTGVEYYDANNPVQDLTSIDFAADRTYRTSGILAIPGYGYVFE